MDRGLFRRFVDLNTTLSKKVSLTALSEYAAHVEYLRLAALLFACPDINRIIDVAAGSKWHFPPAYKEGFNLNLTGIDIDSAALSENKILDYRIAEDVCSGSLFGTGDFDLVTCYSGIEHFPNVDAFLKGCFDSLRPGGAAIMQFPSSLAPFAILNRILGQRTKVALIKTLAPERVDEIGYPAFYNRCRYSEFKQSAETAGFIVEYYLPYFMSSAYLYWLFPAYLISQIVDVARMLIGIRDTASYNLFVLRKPGKHFKIMWSWRAEE
jgi:SAM-dependent methyltransferase